MTVNYRVGTHKDIPAIAHYLHMSAGGLSDYLIEGLLVGREVNEFIELAVADESTNIFYKNTVVADVAGDIRGMINFYPSEQHEIPDIMYSFLSDEKLDVISPLFKGLPADSLYIYSLACDPTYSKTNVLVFADLMIHCFQSPRATEFQTVCAHVWPNNTKFLNFLLNAGGEIIKRIPVKPQAAFDYQDEIYMLSYDISENK